MTIPVAEPRQRSRSKSPVSECPEAQKPFRRIRKGSVMNDELNPSDQRRGSPFGIVLAMPTVRQPMSENPKDMKWRL